MQMNLMWITMSFECLPPTLEYVGRVAKLSIMNDWIKLLECLLNRNEKEIGTLAALIEPDLITIN